MTDLRKAIIKLAYDNPEIREDLVPLLSEMVSEGRFEEGKPADPTENMTEEEAAEWELMNEKYKDKFKDEEKEASLHDNLVRLAYENPELRDDLVPLLRDAGNKDTFKIAEFPHEGYAMRRTETHRRRFAFDTSDAEDHLAGWDRDGTRQHIPGFLTWAWDMRKETLKDLDRRNYGAIAEELAYSAKQDPAYRDESYADLEAGFVDYLKNWRTELLEALDESLSDRNASSRNRQADGSTFKIAEFPREGYAMRRTETHRRRFAFDTSDAEDHLAGWDRDGTRQHIPGFLTWAWDMRKETLKDLDRRNYGAIAEELAYSAKQDPAYRDESYADLEAGFVDYLKNWRTELLEALDESLSDRNASSRNRQADGSTFTCPHCEGKVL